MANVITVQSMARDLMTTHGVGSLQFGFDRSKNRLGATHFMRAGGVSVPLKITLSKHFVELLPEDEIRDVILHEIAHAKVGHSAGHGPAWRAAARAVGAKPQRCATPSASPEKSVTAYCPTCGEQRAAQHRLPQKVYVCRQHRYRPLVWKKNGEEVPLSAMPSSYRETMRRAGF